MAKALKIIVGLVLALVLIVVVGMVALLVFVDPNAYRGQIEAAVKEQTGRTLAIEGDMRLSVFPWLGLELGRVSLGNAPGFGDSPFAEVGAAQVRAKLLPLLRKRLEVGKLSLRGLRLDLQVDKSGHSNWADLAGGGEAAAPAPSAQQPAAPAAQGPGLAALAIGGLEVSDAQVSFRDAVTGASYAVRDLSLTSGAIALGQPTDVTLAFAAEANQPQIAANVELASRITVAPALQQFTLAGTRLKVDGKGAVLPVPELAAQLDGDIALDLAADTVTLGKLELQALGVKLLGEVSGSGLTKAPRFNGHLRLEPFSPRDLLTRLGQAAPETADKGVLGKASLDTAFEATTANARLSDLKLLLDDTALTGTLAVEDFAKQALRFDLAVDGINLDRYLPPPSEAPPPPTAGSAAVGTAELPMELLRSLDIAGKLSIGKLIASNLHSEAVQITLNAKGGRIVIHPATAKLYGGSYSGNIALDATGKEPAYALDEKLDQVQVGPLLKDLMGDDKLHGTANLQAKITARGAAPPAIRQTLNGTASFAFTDGMIKGINIAQQLRDARAKLKGEKPPKSDEPNATDFSALGGSFTIKNGVVDNRDLDAKSPLLRVQGAGTADIAKETLDYRLKVAVVGSLSGQGGQTLQDLKGLTIPLRIHGPFADPGIRVELGEALSAEQKAKLEAQKKALSEKEAAAKAALKAKEEAAKEAQRKKLEEKKKELQKQLEEKLQNLRK